MKKILIVLPIVLAITVIISYSQDFHPFHRMVKEVVINYSKTDSPYIYCGVMKDIYRKYNYTYKDSFYHWDATLDSKHAKYYYTNEFGDTVFISYCDYSDFPKDYRFD